MADFKRLEKAYEEVKGSLLYESTALKALEYLGFIPYKEISHNHIKHYIRQIDSMDLEKLENFMEYLEDCKDYKSLTLVQYLTQAAGYTFTRRNHIRYEINRIG